MPVAAPDNILDYLDDVELTFLAREVPEPFENPLSKIFPNHEQRGTTARIAKGTIKYFTADFRAFGAEAPIGKREAELVASEFTLPPISQKLPLDEVLIRELSDHASDSNINRFVEKAFNDTENNVRAIRHRVEKARGELLSTGVVDIDENGVRQTFDFGLDASHKVTAPVLWSDPTADILTDEKTWIKTVHTDSLERPKYATISDALLGFFARNEYYRNQIYPGLDNSPSLTLDQVNQVRRMLRLPELNVYDEQVPGAAGTVDVLPSNLYILTTESFGLTRWGETTESMKLSRSRAIDFQAEDRPGITVTTWSEPDPVAEWNKAAAVVLPTAEDINGLLVATVLA